MIEDIEPQSTKSGPKLAEVGFAVRGSSKKFCFVFLFALLLPRAKIGISQCCRQDSTLRHSVRPLVLPWVKSLPLSADGICALDLINII